MAFIDNNNTVHDALVMDFKIKVPWENTIYDYTNGSEYSIVNNEEIFFDFSKMEFYKNISTKYELQPYKISIVYGDGERDILIKKFNLNKNTFFKEEPWAVVKHKFNVSNKKEGQILYIEINFYFETGNVFKVVIPYITIFKTIEEMNVDLILLNANITNDGGVSYLFKNATNDTVIIVKKKLDDKTFILNKNEISEKEDNDILDGFDENNIPENFDVIMPSIKNANFTNFNNIEHF